MFVSQFRAFWLVETVRLVIHTPVDSFQILCRGHKPSIQASIPQTIIQIMNILSVFVLLAIPLKCVVASGDTLGVEFREAVDGENVGWLMMNRNSWVGRKDLLDDVITRGVDVTVRLIQSVGEFAKKCVLAALFDKGEGMIDEVLEKVEYNDRDLEGLTFYRKELASSPEKFFRILDKIEEPEKQEWVVRQSVFYLFRAGGHDLVVPLVNALGKKTFKSKRLRKKAIHEAFDLGAQNGNQDIVRFYYENPAITSKDMLGD